MEIEFEGHYDQRSTFEAVRLATKPSKLNSIIRIGLIIIIGAIFLAYFIVVIDNGSLSTFELVRSGRHLITIPILLYILIQPYISSQLKASRLWKRPFMKLLYSGVFTSGGVAYCSPTGRIETEWEKFGRKHITRNLIVLVTADGVLYIFPRHFFKDDNDWRIVKQLINLKVVEAV